jgi:hypothetical protein
MDLKTSSSSLGQVKVVLPQDDGIMLCRIPVSSSEEHESRVVGFVVVPIQCLEDGGVRVSLWIGSLTAFARSLCFLERSWEVSLLS